MSDTRHEFWPTNRKLFQGIGVFALLGLIACAGTDPDAIGPQGPDESDTEADSKKPVGSTKAAPYSGNQIVVRFKSGVGLRAIANVHAQYRTRLVRAYRIPSNLHLVEVPAGLSIEKAVETYRNNPDVLYAEPNYRYQLNDTVPNDALFDNLWGIHNTGQTGGVADADIDTIEAWDITTGSPDTVIGLIDTGIDYNHEDLAENTFVNPGEIAGNGVDDDNNGFVDDVHGINSMDGSGDPMDYLGHGSHVSGTIAGRGNNGIGVAGVNWEAKIVSCATFSDFGGELDDILTCMEYMLDLKTRPNNPVNIIATNNSWGGGPFSQALYDAISAHNQAGMLFVAAAGNDYQMDTDVFAHYPSSYDLPNIISVLATDHYDQLAYFSNFGPRTVDVGAPGQDVLSALPGNQYDFYSGTSMATPHVTGLVGLLKSQDPTRTPQQLKNLILTGGDVTPGTAGLSLSGRRVNALGSLTCANQTLENRYAPASGNMVVGAGTPVHLGVLSINCAEPSDAPQTVTVLETGETIQLLDPNGSGQFEGVFTPTALGLFTLRFSNGDVVSVSAIGNYDAARTVAFDYRTITGTVLPLSDDDSAAISVPFPIRFAGAEPGFATLFVGSNGIISVTEDIYAYYNTPLPNGTATTIIAPLWDDLNPSAYGTVAYEVLGTEPNRELVIEWRGVPYFPAFGEVTFQVVFFENSPNILFNYADVLFGDSFIDNGQAATVGVQVNSEVARQFSFLEPSLSDGLALLWTMGAPQAAAGPDRAVSPGAEVTLDGSGSADSDGSIAAYEWSQIAGEPVQLIGADSPIATFTAPQNPGTLTFALSVTDNDGEIGTDTINIVVNLNPVANAGSDYERAVNLQGILDGTGSSDPDGVVVGYHWTQLNGDPVEIIGAEMPVATFIAPSRPQYLVFQLTVSDEYGFTARDVVVVEVFANDAPVASAGEDRIVRPGASVALDGLRSFDADGTIAAYSWNVDACVTLAGLCEIELLGADSAAPQFVAPASSGLIQLTLTVTDNVGATASDTIVIAVFRQGPQAIASLGEICAQSGSTVVLDGSSSVDPDGQIVSYQWVQVAGPAVSLSGADTAVASFVAPTTGTTLSFELTVTDDDGMVSTTRIDVPVNTPPVAAANASAVAVSAGSTVTLDATQSTDAAAYEWVQIAGPAAALSNPRSPTPTFVAPAPGSAFALVTFELRVTDACGATATDTVTVVVVAN